MKTVAVQWGEELFEGAGAASGAEFGQLAAPGRLIEISGVGASARYTTAVAQVRQAQLEGETTAWIQPAGGPLYPPDLADSGVDLDALITPVHLPRISVLAARYPSLRIVVDHGAKPDIAAGQLGDWAAGLARLAAAPQVYCKLSGLWNQAAPGADANALATCSLHLLACFGAGRVLWGSDWPHTEQKETAHAANWIDRLHEWLPGAALRQQVFVINPSALYSY